MHYKETTDAYKELPGWIIDGKKKNKKEETNNDACTPHQIESDSIWFQTSQ